MDSKTIVVTGGAGFIGSHLCEALQKAGHRVISLDNYFTGSKENHVPGVEYREGHTKDIATIIPESPDLIYHLGEYSRVEISLSEPDKVWGFNTQDTFGVLEFWRDRKCKLIYAGSSTKFGDGGLGRMQSPYAWSKASNTELVGNYSRWYNLPYAITYFYNVYGPRERPAHEYGTLIETFRRQKKSGKALTVVSPGTQKRNFTHVDDIVQGLLIIGEKGEGGDYGLGAEESFSVVEVATLFGGEIDMLPARAGNRMDSTLDTTKARALGWSATHKLGDYIRAI